MTIQQQIQFEQNNIAESNLLIQQAIEQKNLRVLRINVSSNIDSYMCLGLLHWRMKQNPSEYFGGLIHFTQKASAAMVSIDSESARLYPIDWASTIYAASLVGLPHPAINLDTQDDHTLASAFFGNVLIGAADIADWPKYDRLPKTKRYQLANETDALYAGLLAGHITPEEGVPLAEELWARREDDDYFQSGGEGGGDENHQIVDYRLGAILKKIGSTVPTVHAWRW